MDNRKIENPTLLEQEIETAFSQFLRNVRDKKDLDEMNDNQWFELFEATSSYNGNVLAAWRIFKAGYKAALHLTNPPKE